MKISLFVKNTVILTVYGVGLRVIGMLFKIILQRRIGAECTGLYQQVFSVYMLLTGSLNAGLSTAVTRLVSEREKSTKSVMRTALWAAVIISSATGAGSLFCAEYIGKIIGDMRCVQAVRILSFSLPFMAVSACCKGWFAARQRTLPPSNVQLFEQIARICAVFAALTFFSTDDTAICCACVLFGDTAAEILSCLLIVILWWVDSKKHSSDGNKKTGAALARIAFPVGAGRLGNSVLRTAESIVTPNALATHYGARSVALSKFATVRAMALPIMLFPSALLGAVSSLMIPVLAGVSESVARERVERALSVTVKLSFGCAAVMFCVADELGLFLYNNAEVGYVIRILSPVLPLMYLQFVTDGILFGLDRQTPLMVYGLTDSGLRVVLIMLVVPYFGVQGLLSVIIFSNLFTGVLSFVSLYRVCSPKLDVVSDILRPTVCAVLCAAGAFFDYGELLPRLIIKTILCALAYRVTVGKIAYKSYAKSENDGGKSIYTDAFQKN